MVAHCGQTPSAPAHVSDAEGTHQGLTRLGFTSHQKLHSTTRAASQCRGGNLHPDACIQALLEQFCAPADPQAPLPTHSQQHEGNSKAASLLLDTSPRQSWSPLCSQHYYECPSLNTLIILRHYFFEAREGVRLLMALQHFLNEAQSCSPFLIASST